MRSEAKKKRLFKLFFKEKMSLGVEIKQYIKIISLISGVLIFLLFISNDHRYFENFLLKNLNNVFKIRFFGDSLHLELHADFFTF